MLNLLFNIFMYWFYYIFRFGGNKVNYLRWLGVRIGEQCSIMNRINDFSEPWLVEIGNNVTLASGVLLITHDGASRVVRRNIVGANKKFGNKFGTIRILDNCFIGVSAIILGDVVVGPNSIVGAGSVVTKNIPPNMVYAGNPAKPICSLEEYIEKYSGKLTQINAQDRKGLRSELTTKLWGEIR